METKNIFEFAFLPDYSNKIEELAKLAREERWDFLKDEDPRVHPILQNYINHTFKRLQDLHTAYPEQGYLFVNDTQTCFNTGLFTKNFEPIFALFKKNAPEKDRDWKLQGFYKESASELRSIALLPRRASYFTDVTNLFYDTNLELRINIDHILDDARNRERIPEQYRSQPYLPMLFRGAALQYARIRILENYKAAVPQYFNGKIQFLLPISLGDPSVVDLSLAVGRQGDIYTGHTCLTLDMAYNNARLIAKPESDWLV